MTKEQKIVANNHLVNIKYYNKNSQLTLIFLHGWGSNLATWNGIFNYLSEHEYNLLCIDLPGFGKSSELKKTFYTSDFVITVKDIIDKLKINKYILVGHSFGGQIILKGIIDKLLEPHAIVLINSAGIRKGFKKIFLSNISKVFKKILPFGLKILIYKYIFRSDDYINTLGSQNLKSTFLNIISEDISNNLLDLKINTLIIWGDKDTITPLRHAMIFHKKLKNSRLEVIEGDHFIPITNANKMVEIILNWLNFQ